MRHLIFVVAVTANLHWGQALAAQGQARRTEKGQATMAPAFDPGRDLIALHYDHAPDKDDGHSAAADRTLLESLYGTAWISNRVVAVSGAYGRNRTSFNVRSDHVMDAAWQDCGGWVDAHRDWTGSVTRLAARWGATLAASGHIHVKEGGQSDITAEIVKQLQAQHPEVAFTQRVHVIQHSTWNEQQTTPAALAYVRTNAHYVRIPDANRYLNVKGGDAAFERAATNSPAFRPVWQAAFRYYSPRERLDFSDTGELLYILGLGEVSIPEFRERFLRPHSSTR